jgi:hypothetical protein
MHAFVLRTFPSDSPSALGSASATVARCLPLFVQFSFAMSTHCKFVIFLNLSKVWRDGMRDAQTTETDKATSTLRADI